jgi:transposase
MERGPGGLISLDQWQDIRERGIGKQEPIKQISRETGIAINTIRKCLRSSSPPERRGSPTRTSAMTAYESDVDALLKQEPRITAARMAQVLREKYPAFVLKERAVRIYVARRRTRMHPKEVFIRQVYVPGDQTQYDFKDIKAIIGGEEIDLHLFTARLSCSTAWFGHCYRTEDQPALFDGFLRAAVEFNGVTRDGVFDNPKTAVIKVLRGRHRKVNAEFAAFTGSLAIDMQFAAPAKGNEKGGVEGAHGYVEDNFFRPMRSAVSLEALNDELLAFSRADREHHIVDGHTVAERLVFERAALKPLPAILPRPCIHEHVRVNKFGEVRCRTNRYSVPTQFVCRPATIELFADRVRIIVDDELTAEWERLFGRNEAALDPLHYLVALKRKHRAVERAAVFNNERFPEALRALLKRLVQRDRDTAGKQFMRVVEFLVQHRMAEVVAAVELAAEQGVDDPAAIALLLDQRSSTAPQPLALGILPQAAQIAAPQVRLDGYIIAELKEMEEAAA